MQLALDDTVSFLLKQAGRAPLLNKGQEIELSRQVQAWLAADNPDARTIKRGSRAKRRMIESNMRLAIHTAKKYQRRIASNPGLSFEDLIQEATLGLNRAVEKFDPERGYAFSTYATLWCRQACGRYCDINSSAVRVATHAHQTALKWQYRPHGQTLEEFAAGREQTPEKIKQILALWNRAQCASLDCKTNDDEKRSCSLIDQIPAEQPIEDEQDYAKILDDLKFLDGGVLKESLAVLEIAEEAKSGEIAELMGWSRSAVYRKLQDCRSQIREHMPEHVREMILGPERQVESAKMEPAPLPKRQPARELVLAHAPVKTSYLPMTQSIQPTTNGHSKSLEAEAMEVIETVKAEPAEVQAEPKRRRRTKAEVQAEKDSKNISVIADGVSLQGDVEDIAKLIGAMQKAA